MSSHPASIFRQDSLPTLLPSGKPPHDFLISPQKPSMPDSLISPQHSLFSQGDPFGSLRVTRLSDDSPAFIAVDGYPGSQRQPTKPTQDATKNRGFEAMQTLEQASWGLDVPQRSVSAPVSDEQRNQQLEQDSTNNRNWSRYEAMQTLEEPAKISLGASTTRESSGIHAPRSEFLCERGWPRAHTRQNVGLLGSPGIEVKIPLDIKPGDHQLHHARRPYGRPALARNDLVPTINEGGPKISLSLSLALSGNDDVQCLLQREIMRDMASVGLGLSGCTTAMVQNIPGKYTQQKLMQEINARGFKGAYDFLYLPMDSRNRSSRGFAFMNFVSAVHAQVFYFIYDGQRLAEFVESTMENLQVVPADVQGYEANLERYKASCMKRKYKHHSKPFFSPPITANYNFQGLEECVRFFASKSQEAVEGHSLHIGNRIKSIARFCQSCGMPKLPSHNFCEYCGVAFRMAMD